jgi:hypothetical protein
MMVLRGKITEAGSELMRLDWRAGDVPGDVTPFFAEVLGAAQAEIDASTDLRSLSTAYAQAFHQHRPTLARLAEAQRAKRAGLIKRYTPNTVDAINELMSDDPDLATIERAFRSISVADLVGCTPAIDRKLASSQERSSRRSR